MIIDIHTHIFPDEMAPAVMKVMSAESNYTPSGTATRSDVVAALARAGCDYGVLQPVATTPHIKHANEFASQNEGLPLLWFGAIHPDSEAPERVIEQLKQEGARGIKLHPFYQHTDIDDQRYVRLIRAAAEQRMAVLFHAGFDPAFTEPRCTTAKMLHLLDEVEGLPNLQLIAAHLGGLNYYADTEQYLCGRDIYFDTAIVGGWVGKEQYRRIIDKHGYEKVLLGSDYPWQSPTDAIRYLQELELPLEQEQAILGDNAARLLGLQ